MLVSLALGNPLGINVKEIGTEELVLEDFDEEEVEGIDMAYFGGVEYDDSGLRYGIPRVNRLYSIHISRLTRIGT